MCPKSPDLESGDWIKFFRGSGFYAQAFDQLFQLFFFPGLAAEIFGHELRAAQAQGHGGNGLQIFRGDLASGHPRRRRHGRLRTR